MHQQNIGPAGFLLRLGRLKGTINLRFINRKNSTSVFNWPPHATFKDIFTYVTLFCEQYVTYDVILLRRRKQTKTKQISFFVSSVRKLVERFRDGGRRTAAVVNRHANACRYRRRHANEGRLRPGTTGLRREDCSRGGHQLRRRHKAAIGLQKYI